MHLAKSDVWGAKTDSCIPLQNLLPQRDVNTDSTTRLDNVQVLRGLPISSTDLGHL